MNHVEWKQNGSNWLPSSSRSDGHLGLKSVRRTDYSTHLFSKRGNSHWWDTLWNTIDRSKHERAKGLLPRPWKVLCLLSDFFEIKDEVQHETRRDHQTSSLNRSNLGFEGQWWRGSNPLVGEENSILLLLSPRNEPAYNVIAGNCECSVSSGPVAGLEHIRGRHHCWKTATRDSTDLARPGCHQIHRSCQQIQLSVESIQSKKTYLVSSDSWVLVLDLLVCKAKVNDESTRTRAVKS